MLLVSAMSTYGAMYFVAVTIPIISATMSLVTSILIAFCFDYQLFLLSRFREAAQNSKNVSCGDAVVEMLEHAGHNCAVSGATLVFAFLGLVKSSYPLFLLVAKSFFDIRPLFRRAFCADLAWEGLFESRYFLGGFFFFLFCFIFSVLSR